MSLTSRPENSRLPRFPRVSGDEPVNDAATDFIRWFSPRERG